MGIKTCEKCNGTGEIAICKNGYLEIDGKQEKVEYILLDGVETAIHRRCFVVGKDNTGRTCLVAEHDIPSRIFNEPKIKATTGGHTYQGIF